MILEAVGEDTKREGLLDTPYRVAKSLQFLTKGYKENPKDVINDAIFHEESTEMILIKDVEVYSLCEHHMLPFFWKGAYCLHPQQKNYRIVKSVTCCGSFYKTSANPGAAHRSDCKLS